MGKWKRGSFVETELTEHWPELIKKAIKMSEQGVIFEQSADGRHQVAQLMKGDNFIANRILIENTPEAIALIRSISKMDQEYNPLIVEAYEFIAKLDKQIKDESNT